MYDMSLNAEIEITMLQKVIRLAFIGSNWSYCLNRFLNQIESKTKPTKTQAIKMLWIMFEIVLADSQSAPSG
jgi:hypothetical protein